MEKEREEETEIVVKIMGKKSEEREQDGGKEEREGTGERKEV